MARPRVLTDEQRAESNRERQARWRKKHEGFARLKVKNDHARRREEGKEVEVGSEVRVPEKREVRGVEETYCTESMDEVEGDEKVMREHWEMMERRLGRQAPLEARVGNLAKERVVTKEWVKTEEERRVEEELERFKGKREAREVEVEM